MKTLCSHDQDVFLKIKNIFITDIELFLKDFDFSYNGDKSLVDPIIELTHFIDSSEYELIDIDESFEQTYKGFVVSLKNFSYKFVTYTIPVSSSRFGVVMHRNEYDMDLEKKKQIDREIKVLNDAADDLYKKMRHFLTEGKRRLQVSKSDNTTNSINVYGGSVNAAIGDNATQTNQIRNEFNEKLEELIQKLLESNLEDKEEVVASIQEAKQENNKDKIMKLLGDLLSRGAEAAGFMASIAAIMSL